MEYIIVRDNSNDLKPIEYLDTIEVVDFKKNRSSFYKGGEPNNG